MKKILSVMLVLTMLLSFAACAPAANNDDNNATNNTADTTGTDTGNDVVVPGTALELLETVWAAVPEDNKFSAMGGDYEAMVNGAPGAVKDAGFMTGTLHVPEDATANVSETAALVHGMMLNNFTCGAYKVADSAAFAKTMYDAISNVAWMCGMPEKLVIATLGDYVVVFFGLNDAVNPFETALTTAYPGAVVVNSEAITE